MLSRFLPENTLKSIKELGPHELVNYARSKKDLFKEIIFHNPFDAYDIGTFVIFRFHNMYNVLTLISGIEDSEFYWTVPLRIQQIAFVDDDINIINSKNNVDERFRDYAAHIIRNFPYFKNQQSSNLALFPPEWGFYECLYFNPNHNNEPWELFDFASEIKESKEKEEKHLFPFLEPIISKIEMLEKEISDLKAKLLEKDKELDKMVEHEKILEGDR